MSNITVKPRGLGIRLTEAEVQLLCLALGAFSGISYRDNEGKMPESVWKGVESIMSKINKAREEQA